MLLAVYMIYKECVPFNNYLLNQVSRIVYMNEPGKGAAVFLAYDNTVSF